jgi:hypothetical protein
MAHMSFRGVIITNEDFCRADGPWPSFKTLAFPRVGDRVVIREIASQQNNTQWKERRNHFENPQTTHDGKFKKSNSIMTLI